MGVPTITLTGNSMISRQGVALLGAAGMSDWIAADPGDYVRKAVAFAGDLDALGQLRGALRSRLPTTALFDVRRFARYLEVALASIWAKHVEDSVAATGHDTTTQTTQSVTTVESVAG